VECLIDHFKNSAKHLAPKSLKEPSDELETAAMMQSNNAIVSSFSYFEFYSINGSEYKILLCRSCLGKPVDQLKDQWLKKLL
jgi:hypothetical protein